MSPSNSLVLTLVLAAAAAAIVPGRAEAQAGAAAEPPVQISGFLTGHTRLYYKNRNRYHALAYQRGVRIFNKFTAVRFVNNSAQAIQKIIFELAAYDNGYHAIHRQDGKLVVKNMVATGPFAPAVTQVLVNANTVWVIPSGSGLGCVRMTGINLTYADGSTATVPESEVNRYFIASLNNSCGVPAGKAAKSRDNFATGPSPYIAGVYPAKWMTVGLPMNELARQPFVAPSDTQPLCVVGSFLEENCAAESARSGL